MNTPSNMRDGLMIAGLGVIILVVWMWLGSASTIQLMISAVSYAMVALGLNLQWGYGGQFNFGVMGFLMLGGYAVVLTSYPVNEAFWSSDGPAMLGVAIITAGLGALLVFAANRADRIGIRGKTKTFLIVLAWAIAYIAFRAKIDPAATLIEKEAGFIGGLGLPTILGWLVGGAFAGAVAYLIGKVCLGLRTDYLAIATIGIAEIIRSLLKNMDWLTHGTLTVSPLPWPVPTPLESGFDDRMIALLFSRSAFLSLAVLAVAIVFVLLQRAFNAPWGRMMRAIRDNHIAAEAMGKNIRSRQIEIFVLGAVLMGIGGALMATYVQLYDPGGYQPISHTFIVWVMVIVGGAGSNIGAMFGAVLIIISWSISAPLSALLFHQIDQFSTWMGWGEIPNLDARALQMRVFLLGVVITLALRYAPRGLIPERIKHHD
ncbi:MAG: branched-chain amino acid ABC transporter permease [Alphaproteobacteria bacterium]